MPLVRGALRDSEKQYIEKHLNDKPIEQIAAELNRSEEIVRKYARLHLGFEENVVAAKEQGRLIHSLRNSEDWKIVKKQFTSEELQFYEMRYADIVKQFKEDITPTELIQIHQLIKYEILMNRNLLDRQTHKLNKEMLNKNLESIREEIAEEEDKDECRRLRELALNHQTQITAMEIAEQNASKEYTMLDEKHNKLLEALKSTRAQRIEKNINTNRNWADVIKMLEQRDIQEQENRFLNLFRKATDIEYAKLSKPYQFTEFEADPPILTNETAPEFTTAE